MPLLSRTFFLLIFSSHSMVKNTGFEAWHSRLKFRLWIWASCDSSLGLFGPGHGSEHSPALTGVLRVTGQHPLHTELVSAEAGLFSPAVILPRLSEMSPHHSLFSCSALLDVMALIFIWGYFMPCSLFFECLSLPLEHNLHERRDFVHHCSPLYLLVLGSLWNHLCMNTRNFKLNDL